jgi:hypothetical protein
MRDQDAAMIEFAEDERQQLRSRNAVDVVVAQTAQRCVVLRQDVYEESNTCSSTTPIGRRTN